MSSAAVVIGALRVNDSEEIKHNMEKPPLTTFGMYIY